MWNPKAVRAAQGVASARELAHMFGVSRYTIYAWAKSGKLPLARKYAGLIGWDMDEVRKFIGMGKTEGAHGQAE